MQQCTRYKAAQAFDVLGLIKSRIDDDAIGDNRFFEGYMRDLLGKEVSTWHEKNECLNHVRPSTKVPNILAEVDQLTVEDLDLVIELLNIIKRIKQDHIAINMVRVLDDTIIVRGVRNGNQKTLRGLSPLIGYSML